MVVTICQFPPSLTKIRESSQFNSLGTGWPTLVAKSCVSDIVDVSQVILKTSAAWPTAIYNSLP